MKYTKIDAKNISIFLHELKNRRATVEYAYVSESWNGGVWSWQEACIEGSLCVCLSVYLELLEICLPVSIFFFLLLSRLHYRT